VSKKKNKGQKGSDNKKGLKLRRINPKTESQERVFDSFDDDLNMVLTGAAGTGKTFLSLYLALEEMSQVEMGIRSIKIFRSSVPTRDMGFMPGNMNEKLAVYEAPYVAMVNDLYNCGTAYASLKSQNKIEFLSTSFNRGITINNSIIIVDEAQNMTDHEISTIITRMGRNCRIIFCGDSFQVDLNTHREQSGIGTLIRVAEQMDRDFDVIRFTPDDIVRNDMIKRYLKARISLGV